MVSFRSGGRRGVMEGIEQREEPPDRPGVTVKGLWILKENMNGGSQLPFPRAPGPFSAMVLLSPT